RPAATFLDGRVEIDARRLHGRHQPEHQPGGERDKGREREYTPIHADTGAADANARDVARIDRQQRPNADDTQHQPEPAADHRQHDALREQLTDDATADGANGGANGDLPLADG